MLKPVSYLSITCLFFILSGCVTEGLMRTWSTDQEYDQQFKKLMVMGLVNNPTLRSQVEDEVVMASSKIGLTAVNGMSMFPPELGRPFDDIEAVKSRLRSKAFDGIITVTLVDITAERYIKTQEVYQPLGYYDRFGTYYRNTYALVYRQDYFATYAKYFIETNFYELKEGRLVWSGRSNIFEPSQLENYLPSYAKGLFKELKLEGVILP